MKKKILILSLALALVIACVLTVAVVSGRDYESLSGWQRTVYAIFNREEILATEFVGEQSEETWSQTDEYDANSYAVVQKTPGEDFVVMNISDLHLSDYTQDSVTNIRNLNNIRRMVRELQPDLITLSGDLVWKESTVYSVHRLTEFMDSLGVPWAPIFGNHDADGNCDLNYLADVMMESALCLMRKGDPSLGVGNYVVNICEGDTIVHSLILMDTHGNGKLTQDQIAWYRWAAQGAGTASSLVLHIPIAQYQYAFDAAWDAESGTWTENSGAFGCKGEDVCCATDENDDPLDCGLFAALQEIGTTKNILCGHDHANTFSVMWEDVRLTYSLRLGYGAYFERYNQGVSTLTVSDSGEAVVAHHYLYPYDVENP